MSKTHCQILKEMLENRPYITIDEIRGWANYRSRLSDCRAKYGMNIVPDTIIGPNGHKVHIYKLAPRETQSEFFKLSGHDGVVKVVV